MLDSRSWGVTRLLCPILALAVTGGLSQVVISSAGAFTFPTGATTSSACPAFPADPTQPAADGVVSQTLTSVASTWVYSSTPTVVAGSYQLAYASSTGYWVVQSQDSAGTWELDAEGGAPYILGGAIQVPAGPVRVGIYQATSSLAVAVELELTPVATQAGGSAQSLAVLCADAMSNAGQAHTDSGTLATDVTGAGAQAHADSGALAAAVNAASSTAHTDASAIDGDVNALGGGKTLATLDTDLGAIATDLGTLHADDGTTQADLGTIAADESGGGGGGGGTGSSATTPQLVELSPADRQLETDLATQGDGDDWVIVGTLIALFVGGVVFAKVLA